MESSATSTADRCGEDFAICFDQIYGEDHPRPQGLPDNIAAGFTYCDGPKGHPGEHVGGIMNGAFAIMWAPWLDAHGAQSFKILDQNKDAV